MEGWPCGAWSWVPAVHPHIHFSHQPQEGGTMGGTEGVVAHMWSVVSCRAGVQVRVQGWLSGSAVAAGGVSGKGGLVGVGGWRLWVHREGEAGGAGAPESWHG